MSDSHTRRGAALRAWRLRVAARRAGTQWRLLAVVGVVAVLVTTLVASLALLVDVTEERSARAVLTTASAERTDVTVRLQALEAPLAEVRALTTPAVHDTLGGQAELTAVATSGLHTIAREDGGPALGYFGELDAVAEHARLLSGRWPAASDEERVEVALTRAGADVLGLRVGDTVELVSYNRRVPVPAELVGVYRPERPAERYWSPDPLDGAGHDPAFAAPGSGGAVTTDGVGPFLVAAGVMDARDIPVEVAVLRYTPRFEAATVGALPGLMDRLRSAPDDVLTAVGDVARQGSVTTRLDALVNEVTTALVVTRASVLVVGLLLVLLAVAALLQTARLLAEARHGEHNLMRARGASGRQLLGLAAVDAALVAVLAAAAGPPAARWVYRLLAQREAMAQAGMSADPGTPASVWLVAAGVAAVLALVVVSPLLRRAGTFVEGEQVRARPDRRAMLARSGLDLMLLGLAGVAYWQLRSYRSPVGRGGSSLVVDPVLVAGPALVLLAGALVAVRLLPAASRVTEALAARGRGVVSPLAAWEIGRRSSRATAAVLLLTLALAVGTFSQSFLATWQQSQADQAAYATGAPVRVDDLASAATLQVAALRGPGAGEAQPVLRRDAELAGWNSQTFGAPPRGRPVEVLALTAPARQMLDRGRVAREGGTTVARLDAPLAEVEGVEVPADLHGVTARVRVGDEESAVPGTATILRAVLEDATGLITTVDLGIVPIDGRARDVRGMLPDVALTGDPGRQGPLRLVGMQVVMFVAYPADAPRGQAGEIDVELLVDELAVLHPGEDGLEESAVEVPETIRWFAASRGLVPLSTEAPEGWQLGLRVTGSVNELLYSPGSVVQIGWPAADLLPVVLTGPLARQLGVEPGMAMQLVLDGVTVPVVLADTVHRVPTTSARDVVVLDHTQLARALAQSGVSGTAVSEWWVDVPDAQVPAYLAALAEDPDGTPTAARVTSTVQVTEDMQQHPLRVATQAGLWLVTLAAAALAAVGFGVHATVTLRARAVEFAQLRAIGLSRRRLTAVVASESMLLCLLGGVFGIGLGALLGWLVGPLVAVSADGRPPVPAVLVQVPWGDVALLAAEVVVLLAVVVLVVARSQRSADPATVLRLGDER